MSLPPPMSLVAAWPGAGQAGLVAASCLVRRLRMRPLNGLLDERDTRHELHELPVRGGLLELATVPRHQAYIRELEDTSLVVLLGAAPECRGGYETCQRLLRRFASLGAERAVFLDGQCAGGPVVEPRVFDAATTAALQRQLRERSRTLPLPDGFVRSTAASFLGAAMAVGLPAAGLFAEVPSCSAQRLFCPGARALLAALQDLLALPPLLERGEPPRKSALEAEIEELFALVRIDRGQAGRLKHVLDREGLFEVYEDRFLDLFAPAPGNPEA